MAVDSIVYSLKGGVWTGRRREEEEEEEGGGEGAWTSLKSNNPNLKGGEKRVLKE